MEPFNTNMPSDSGITHSEVEQPMSDSSEPIVISCNIRTNTKRSISDAEMSPPANTRRSMMINNRNNSTDSIPLYDYSSETNGQFSDPELTKDLETYKSRSPSVASPSSLSLSPIGAQSACTAAAASPNDALGQKTTSAPTTTKFEVSLTLNPQINNLHKSIENSAITLREQNSESVSLSSPLISNLVISHTNMGLDSTPEGTALPSLQDDILDQMSPRPLEPSASFDSDNIMEEDSINNSKGEFANIRTCDITAQDLDSKLSEFLAAPKDDLAEVYLIPSQWVAIIKQLAQTEPTTNQIPLLDNSSLLTKLGNFLLPADVISFEEISAMAWDYLQDQGLIDFDTQAICRFRNAETGEVEYYAPIFKLVAFGEIDESISPRTISLSVATKISDIYELTKETFDVYSVDQIRLWKIVDPEWDTTTKKLNYDIFHAIQGKDEFTEIFTFDADSTLADMGFEQGQSYNFIVEVQSSSGAWPSENKPVPVYKHVIPARRNPYADNVKKPAGTIGLSNLGNTCYMNSALQCLTHVEELVNYFASDYYRKEINITNPIGMNGDVAAVFGKLINSLYNNNSYESAFSPREFKSVIGRYGSAFDGYQQQDSQEFLAFLLDGLHEDLNRVIAKPATQKPELPNEEEHSMTAIAKLAEECWEVHKKRNDSIILDLFSGLYRSTLVCPVSNNVSVTFDPFMDLTLPLPVDRTFNRDITIFGIRNSAPIILPIELDKYSSIKQLKVYIIEKLKLQDVTPDQIIVSEIYSNQFYKHYEDTDGVADIATDEVVCAYITHNNIECEEDSIGAESDIELDIGLESDATQQFFIPVFHRKLREEEESETSRYTSHKNTEMFQLPFFITLTAKEAKDYNIIYHKIFTQYLSLFKSSEKIYQNLLSVSADDFADHERFPLNIAVPGTSRYSRYNATKYYADFQMSTSKIIPIQDRMPKIESPAPISVEKSSFADTDDEDEDELDDTPYFEEKNTDENAEERSAPSSMNSNFTSASSTSVFTPPESPVLTGNAAPSVVNIDESDIESSSQVEHIEEASQDAIVLNSADEGQEKNGETDGEYPEEGFEALFDELNSNNNDSTSNGRICDDNVDTAISPSNNAPQHLVMPNEAIIVDWSHELFEFITSNCADSYERISDPEVEAKIAANLEKKQNGFDLNDCLDLFAKPEVLGENDTWYCSKCQDFRQAEKTIELWQVPDILTIHLKRFASNRSFRDKIDAVVKFPIEGLDLTDRVGSAKYRKELGENPEDVSLIYDLFAVDNHYGGLGGGHYTAYAKNFKDGKWYYFDDSRVRETEPEQSITGAAYLLFYRRRSSKPLGGAKMEEIMKDIERKRQAVSDSTNNEFDSDIEEPRKPLGNAASSNVSDKFKGEGHVLGRSISGPAPFMRYGNLATLNTTNSVGYSFGTSNSSTLPTIGSNLEAPNFEDNAAFLGIDTDDEMAVDDNNDGDGDDDDDDEYDDNDEESMDDVDDAEEDDDDDDELVDDDFVSDL